MQLSVSKALAIGRNLEAPFANETKTSVAIWNWSFAHGHGSSRRVDHDGGCMACALLEVPCLEWMANPGPNSRSIASSSDRSLWCSHIGCHVADFGSRSDRVLIREVLRERVVEYRCFSTAFFLLPVPRTRKNVPAEPHAIGRELSGFKSGWRRNIGSLVGVRRHRECEGLGCVATPAPSIHQRFPSFVASLCFQGSLR